MTALVKELKARGLHAFMRDLGYVCGSLVVIWAYFWIAGAVFVALGVQI